METSSALDQGFQQLKTLSDETDVHCKKKLRIIQDLQGKLNKRMNDSDKSFEGIVHFFDS